MIEPGEVRWAIYYDDGTRFTNLDGPPHKAPGTGVQVIIQLDDRTGRFNQAGDQVYYWKNERWWGGDHFGMLIELLNTDHPVVVRFGSMMGTEGFHEILRNAEADPIWPKRSAWEKSELRPEWFEGKTG